MTIRDYTTFTYDNLISDIPSESDCYDELKEVLNDVVPESNTDITDYSIGSFYDCILRLGARTYSVGINDSAVLAESQFASNAVGNNLDAVTSGFYELPREPGSPTHGYFRFTLTDASAGPYVFETSELEIEEASTRTTFTNTEGFTLNSTTTIRDIAVECTTSGTIGNISNNSTLSFVRPIPGVTITNPAYSGSLWLSTYGTDVEIDDRLRRRAITRWSTLERGENNRSHLEYQILSASNSVAFVNIDDQNPRGAGTVDVYICGATGVATAADIDLIQSGTLNNLFYGNDVGTPRVQCYSATPVTASLSGQIFYVGNLSTVKTAMLTNLKSFIGSFPMGGNRYTSISTNQGILWQSELAEVIDGTPGVSKINLGSTGWIDGKLYFDTNEKLVWPSNDYNNLTWIQLISRR